MPTRSEPFPHTAQPASHEKKIVLVVDDDQGPRESMTLVLESEFDVRAVTSVDEAEKFLDETTPDCVIMDISMPGRSGIDGLAMIRARDLNLSVIMCTAYASIETAQKAIRLQASEYIRKPFTAKELRNSVREQVLRTTALRSRDEIERQVEYIQSNISASLSQTKVMAEAGLAASALVHDLRNPLSSLLGCVYLLDEELRKSEARSLEDHRELTKYYLEKINSTLLRCKELTDSWNSITTKEGMKLELIDLHTVANEILREPLLDSKGLPRHVQLEPPESVIRIQADRVLISRALRNLVSNAIKATSAMDGNITISWEQTKETVRISVTDNGSGIPKENREKILEPFYSNQTQESGTGLGLFIVKRIIDMHSGTLEIDSTVGQGSSFIVSLPLSEEAWSRMF